MAEELFTAEKWFSSTQFCGFHDVNAAAAEDWKSLHFGNTFGQLNCHKNECLKMSKTKDINGK